METITNYRGRKREGLLKKIRQRKMDQLKKATLLL
jgi:hypothetical protein